MPRKAGPGATPLAERLGVSQLVRAYLQRHWSTDDPEYQLIANLADIASDENGNPIQRIQATKILLEYIHGKPKQIIEAAISGETPMLIFKPTDE